jgi:hypothetical protein
MDSAEKLLGVLKGPSGNSRIGLVFDGVGRFSGKRSDSILGE